ncbi:unnamed protein product [Toxocara canis]|uniref:Uncharacterized protein n=1 Tax=Toxocara canis TaxID=6265 RepID=A0A183UCE5_TOXCA|nr:unnamed protein product [Toxocara canis]
MMDVERQGKARPVAKEFRERASARCDAVRDQCTVLSVRMHLLCGCVTTRLLVETMNPFAGVAEGSAISPLAKAIHAQVNQRRILDQKLFTG